MTKTEQQQGVLKPQLWTERSVEETQAVYTDWAANYEAEVKARGYHTPRRIAEALTRHLQSREAPVLDYGCGTGLSGTALKAAGVRQIHGTDINPAMVAEAEPKGIYARLWVSEPGALDILPGSYSAIVATGVVSLGAAPPEALDLLVSKLDAGMLLALSFNDPTLAHGEYNAVLETHLSGGGVSLIERTHGPHLDDVNMGSDVIVLQKL